jgi:hypothetical protein
MTKTSKVLVPLGLCLLLITGCTAAPAAVQPSVTASGIGDWPSFLPTPSAHGIAHGSADSPAMSYPGSPVIVQLATGRITVDVEGPTLPPDTNLNAEQVVCTFTITLRDSDTVVPLVASQFDVLDHTGGVHALALVASTTAPAQVDPHQTVTLKLAATLPSGEGMLRYHPAEGVVVAAWDYIAETD